MAGPTGSLTCSLRSIHQDLASLWRTRTGISVAWRSNRYRSTTLDGVPRREFGSGISASVMQMAEIGQLALRGGSGIPASYLAQMRKARPITGGPDPPQPPQHAQRATPLRAPVVEQQ